jgi:hypothetical protein
LDACVDGFEVFELELGVDDFFVADRVDRAVDVDYVRIVETAKYVKDGVSLADVCEEFIAETFAFRCAFYETCDVDDFDCSRYDALRIDEFGEFVEAFVGNGDYAYVRFDCTEWEVSRLGFCVRKTVEKG